MTYARVLYWGVTTFLAWIWYYFLTYPTVHFSFYKDNFGLDDVQQGAVSFLTLVSVTWIYICTYQLIIWDGWYKDIFKRNKNKK